MAAEIIWGGHVLDPMDRRMVSSLIKRFCNEEVLNDGYKFQQSDEYYQPKFNDIQGFRDCMSSLPDSSIPGIFGLHENALINFSINESNTLVNSIRKVELNDQ